MNLLARLRRDVRRGRAAQIARSFAEESEAIRNVLDELLVEPGPGVVAYGRLATPDGRGAWLGLPTRELSGIHSAHTGATGAGKTMHAIGSGVLQRARDGHSVTSIDSKGEMTALLAETLPGVTGRPVTILKPFTQPAPPLRLTLPERGVDPAAQALGLARDLIGLVEDVSLRQQRVLVKLCELCIELNAPLTALAEWLGNPVTLVRAASRSRNTLLRRFAATLFSTESASTITALQARLDLLFLSPALRQALEAQACIDFHAGFDTPFASTLADLTAPAGCEEAARIIAQLLLGRATRAALSRQVTVDTCDALLVLDEFPQLLGSTHQRDELGRILALARFKKISCILTFQAASMLPKSLLDLVRSCCSIQAVFRQTPEDAHALLPMFPPPQPPASRSDMRAALLRQLCTLPRRECALWVRHRGLEPFIVRAPRLDLAALRERTAEVLAQHLGEPVSAAPAVETPLPPTALPSERAGMTVATDDGPATDDYLDLG